MQQKWSGAVDRFADRRFEDARLIATQGQSHQDSLRFRNNLLFSSAFDLVSPTLFRWVADDRGHILAWRRESGRARLRFAGRPSGLAWRAALDRGDRRQLLHAAQQENPPPLTLRLRGAEGERRWCRVRMQRARTADGDTIIVGTVEDVEDFQRTQAQALETALTESREHYRWSVELSPQVPWTAAPDGRIEEVGPRFTDLTGLPVEQALGLGWLRVLHEEDVPRVSALWTDHLVSGDPIDVDYRIKLRDGGYRWMRARAGARRNDQGRIIRWYGTLEDVHARRVAQRDLAESEERFRLAVQSARLGIWDFDAATGTRNWSAELRRMLGVAQDVEPTAGLALSLVHPDDRDRLRAMLESVAAGTLPAHFEDMLRIHRANDGALRWIKSTSWTTRTEAGRPMRIIVTFLDVTEEHDSEERIRWAATHDPMTRLPNRALWQAGLESMAEEARVRGESFALLLLDIDDLKRTNDSLGHDAGDALLCAFAARLAAAAPPDAVIGRLGGDEFGLIAPSLHNGSLVEAWGSALIEELRRPHLHQGRSLDCGVSMGAALFGADGDRGDELLKAADLALYASKAAGRGRLTLFHSSLRAEAQQRGSMIHMARAVIADDLLMPYYQPKVDLRTRKVTGYEALLRWRHPRLGVQLPGSIAAAFDHGEIAVALTRKMLAAVLHDLVRWLDAGYDPGRIAINASAADFTHSGFADFVLERLLAANVPTDRLEIEVTETVFLGRGADQVASALRCFAHAGVRVALDDFGTGYASLSHLKHYPVNVLKIDRSFVSNMDHDAGDAAIADAIVKLGASFGMEVVAEGVETEAQAQLLRDRGCPIGQGFHLGRPKPFDAIRPGN